MDKLNRIVSEIAKNYRVEEAGEIILIKRALNQKNYSLVSDLLTAKQWQKFKAQYQKKISQPTLFYRYPFKPLQPSNKQGNSIKCVTIGPCGSGKTSFINILCGSNLPSGSSISSLTRNVTQVESLQKYKIPLVLYDTPGTTALQDKLMHAALVRQLLQHAPVNCVIILVKYTNRTDELINSIYRQVKMLPGYEKNILFLITHFDLAPQSSQAEIAQIEKLMKELLPQFTNQMILFSNQAVEHKELSDSIYSIASSYEQVKIKIDDKTFFKYFNLQKSQMEQLFFQACEKQVLKQMDEATDDYIYYAKSLPDNDERQAILQDVEVVLKNQLLSLLDEYTKKYKQTILTYEYYETFYNLQLRKNDNLTRYQNQIRAIRKLQKFIQSEATGSKLDIRDLIKQCPKCHLIWFRIQACPNTSCGSRPSCIFDYIKKPISRFKIMRDKKTKRIVVSKAQTEQDFLSLGIKQGDKGKKFENVNASTLTVETISGDKSIKQRMQTGKALGCGQAMNFQTLPRIQKIDEKLMEWYGTHTIEEVIQMFQKDADLEKTRREVQKKARESFFGFKFF